MSSSAQKGTSVLRDLIGLAWPATLGMTVHSLYRINDQYFVQDLGVEAQAAVAVGSMVALWYFAFGQLISVGNLAITARRLGEGRQGAARRSIRTAVRLAFLVGLLLTLTTLLFREPLSELLIPGEAAAGERRMFLDYIFWVGLAQVVMAVLPSVDSSFFAMKNSRIPMGLEIFAVGTNVLLNSILVPRMGVEGAGLATALSRILPLVFGLAILRASGHRRLLSGPISSTIALRILRIGAPACLAIGIYTAVYQVMLAWTFPQFGSGGRSVLGPGFGIESVFFCFYFGFGQAVGSLVGRSLGAGRIDLARQVARLALRINLILGLASGLSFWFFGPALVGMLASAEEAVQANTEYLNYMAFAQPFQAVQIVYEQVLIGSGLTMPVMISTGVMNAIRIPLAHMLAVSMGMRLPGIWWAINLSTLGKYLWALLLFHRGRWASHQV
ncbi:MAG: MATE family efflux transporter [Planctomycetota bacterium]